MAKFKRGDSIENGGIIHTIVYVTKGNYKLTNDNWMPAKIVDAYWTLVDEESIIED